MFRYFTFFVCLAASVESFGQIEWQKKSGPYGGTIQDIVVHSVNGTVYALGGNNNGTIFRSTDNGVNWTTHAPVIMGNDRVEDLYRLADNTIIALTREDLFQTVDDGANWTKLNTVSGSDSGGFDNGSSVGFNPVSGTWYVMGYHFGDFQNTLFRSLNGGSTWISGHQGFDISGLNQIVTTSAGDVYGVDFGGEMFVSVDDGASFNSVGGDLANTESLISTSTGSQLLALTSSSTLWSFTSPSGPWVIYTEVGIVNLTSYAGGSHLQISPDNGTLFLFDNVNNRVYSKTGVSWTPQSTAFVNAAGENSTCAAAKDGAVLYAGTQDLGVFKSINTGLGWTEVNSGIESLNMRSLVVADDNSIITGGQRAYRSTNGGNSFSRITGTTGYYTALKASAGSPKPLFLLQQNGTSSLKSTDNGVNWSALTTPNNAADYVSPDGVKILGFSNDQLYYTSNQGVAWSAALTVSGLPVDYNMDKLAMDQNAVIYVYLYDYDANSYKFFKIVLNNTTTPTTGTATQIPLVTIGTPQGVSEIEFLNNKIYVLGQNNSFDPILSVTSNAGANWTTKPAEQGFVLEADPINNYLFILKSNGSDYTAYISRDDGDTWVASPVDVPSFKANPYGLALDASGFAYLGFNSSSVHKTLGTIVTPLAPLDLREVGHGSGGLTLRFEDASTNEDDFTIEREINGVFTVVPGFFSFTGSEFGTGRRRYFRDRDLTPGTTYNYRVSAINGGGSSGFLQISVPTLAATAPTIPDNHSWTGVTANMDGLGAPVTNTEIGIKHLGDGRYSITDVTAGILTALTGDAIIPAFFYEASGETYLEPNQVSNTNILEDQNGTWNGTDEIILFWRLDKDGSGGPYPDKYEKITLTRNPTDPTPGPPTNVHAYVYSNSSIEVSWLGAFYEEQFSIERGTSSGGPFTQVGTVNYPATRFIDDGSVLPLTLTSTYFYRVKGSNSTGTSASSVVSPGVTFTIPNFVLTDSEVSNNSTGTGTGFIWRDFDNDGDEDLILTHLHFFFGPPRSPDAFRNDGGGIFTKVDAGMEASKYVTGTAADYDNDGNMDIFLLTTAGDNLLYKGNGNFTFTKVDPNPVAEGSSDLDGASLSAGWVDFDKNGKLDLFVANSGVPNFLYSQSPAGNFAKLTTGDLVTYIGAAQGHSWADYDNDGDADIFIMDGSTETSPNRLYRNNGDGSFTRVTGLEFDTDLNYAGFGSSWGDYDNDGDLDLFMGVQQTSGTTDGENVVYRNNGAGASYTFTKVTNAISEADDPLNPLETFGSAWCDIDNDGNLDLLTGKIGGNIIYKGNGAGAFTRVKNEKFNDVNLANFGVSLADYDKDGFLDVAAACVNPLLFEEGATEGVNSLLFKNNHTASASRNWIQIKLVGTASNKSAIGARVTVTAGGKTQIREVTTTSGFATGGSLIAHFGLGSSTTITTLQVKWPSGLVQAISNQTANVIITITEDSTGPVITTRLPVNGALAASTATLIGLDLDEACTAVATKKLYVYKTSDLVTPVASFDVTTGNHPNANRFEFTLPQKLEANTNYTITVDAGAFEDVYGNDFLGSSTGWTFTTTSGPAVSVLTPANLAIAVPANTSLAIEFDVATTPVAAKNIRLFKAGVASPIATILATSGTISGNKHTYTLATKLERLTGYTVSVDAGAFIDAELNDFAGIVVANWGFTTSSGPQVSVLTPANFATAVPANTIIAIEFNVATTAAAAKNIMLFKAGVVSPIATILATSGTVLGNKHTYTLATKLERLIDYTVSVDVGAFMDAGLNDFAGVAVENWGFTTGTGPVATTLAPASGATNVAANAALVLTFDRNITAVAGKKIKVFEGATTTVVLDVDVSLTGAVSGAQYTVAAPAGNWPYEKTLRVVLDAGAFVDVGLTDGPGISGGTWTFVTVVAPDVTAPVFGSFNVPASVDKTNPQTSFNIPITDATGVTEAKVFFRTISGTTFSESAATQGTGSLWQFNVPATAFDAIGSQFYFTAVDAATNSARSPATGYHQTYLKYTSADAQITSGLVGVGGAKKDWKVIAVPFDLPNKDVTAALEEITSKEIRVDYRLLTYKDANEWGEYPSFFTQLNRGIGYFINIKVATPLSLGNDLTAPNNTRDNLFKINLKAGWNMIGNPYLTPISWGDVATFNNLTGTSAQLRKYNGSATGDPYVPNNSLAAYEGGFVLVSADISNVSIPFLNQTAIGGRKKEIVFEGEDWLVPITLRMGGIENSYAGVGMHRTAQLTFDDLDDVNSPRFNDYLEVNFEHPEFVTGNFARDVVPTQHEFVWEFAVESNMEGLAELHWDNSEFESNSKELFLLDLVRQQPINMLQQSAYSFDPRESNRFRIYFGENVREKIKPARVMLGAAYPNPTANSAIIPFSLPENSSNFNVRLEVFDMLGRKVATLAHGEFNSGFYQAEWMTQDNLTNGVYTYRLLVGGGKNSEVLSGKIMLRK